MSCPALAVVTMLLACRPPAEVPGVPLYPNGATTRLPRDQIAQVYGPIWKIDGRDLTDQPGPFDLLPGCHLVELDRRITASGFSLSSGTYWSGQFPITVYAIAMKAAARYVIRRDILSEGHGGRMILSAREEMPNGPGADLNPVSSNDDIQACKDKAAAMGS